MKLIDDVAAGIGSFDTRPSQQIEAEIFDELQLHLELSTEEYSNSGLAAEDATIAARKRFGDFSRVQRECRRIQLGERIMLQKIQVGLTALMFVAVVLLAAGFYRQQSIHDKALVNLHESVDQMQLGLADMLNQARPIVVSTIPERGAAEVDPSLTEIRATFSKEMMDQSWSWCETEHAYPESTDSIYYQEDHRTCVLPVKLKAGTEYVISLNSKLHQNFRDQYGRSAEPFVLHFKTRDAPTKP